MLVLTELMNCKYNFKDMNNLTFRLAKKEELDNILKLYKNAREEEFCVWNDEYPSQFEIDQDFNSNNLYVAVLDDEIIGALSIVEERELDEYNHWLIKDNIIEMARVVVSKYHHGKNIAKYMVLCAIQICKERNIKSIHIACQNENIPAIKTYKKVGFIFHGEYNIFGHNYYMCEFIL